MQPANPATSISLCTLRLACETPAGQSFGTGFCYNYRLRDPNLHGGEVRDCPVIITNKHVVEGATAIQTAITTFPTPAALPNDSGLMPCEVTMAVRLEGVDFGILGHPDPDVDLCAISASAIHESVPAGHVMRSTHLNSSWKIPAHETAHIRPIEPVVMIGYPDGLWDATHNRPIARRGLTASHPLLMWNGTRQFLIDAACFPGSSGSPVFLFEDGMVRSPRGYTAGTRARLLGILCSGPYLSVQGRMEAPVIPTGKRKVPVVDTMMNLGFVVHASALDDLEPLVLDASRLPGATSTVRGQLSHL